MKKTKILWIGVVAVVLLILIGTVYKGYPYWSALKPVLTDNSGQRSSLIEQLKSNEDLDLSEDEYSGPFTIHPDFRLQVFSDETINPRVLIEDEEGNILVSEPNQSRVSLLNDRGERSDLVTNLQRPHGLALLGSRLFIAETGQVLEFEYENGEATNKQVLLDLPAGGRHWTRTLGIGPDENLYISVGSSCNICIEEDWRRLKILQYDFQTEELSVYASGLRNAVFFEWNEEGELYATEMGRDWLGDDLPPDELNLIKEGQDYGYPYCYGKSIVDPEYNDESRCLVSEDSHFDFIAHEAPLGIDFLNGDAIIALHGSWNRTEPVGYSVIRLSKSSNYQEREDLLTGFLLEDGTSIGRPAGILVTSENEILVSDDKEDVIYKLQVR